MEKGVFLDRDGVINELIYYREHGIIDSPYTVEQFKLIDGICEAINKFHDMRYKVVVVSNQPGIAKNYITQEIFENIRNKMKQELSNGGAYLDSEYYCFHHPDAVVEKLKMDCVCRKPKPGLLLKSAEEMSLDISQSWMIGDSITDIQAGISAGTKTILLGKMKCETCRLMDEAEVHPDFIALSLLEVSNTIYREMKLQ